MMSIRNIHAIPFWETNISQGDIVLPRINQKDINFERVISTENIDTKYTKLGDVDIAGMKLPLGEMISILKHYWPLGGPAKTIKGSLQDYDSEIHLVAYMEGSIGKEWTHSLKIEQPANEDKIPELVKDLAFMITFDLSKDHASGVTAKTWISLKYFTKALDSFARYNSNKKLEYLECARKNCIKALNQSL